MVSGTYQQANGETPPNGVYRRTSEDTAPNDFLDMLPRFEEGEEDEAVEQEQPMVVFENGMDHHGSHLSDEDDPETRCGLGRFHPSSLQMCARVESFTACFSLSALITSTLTVYVNSQVTTLERQFGFSSSQTGLIMAANDIGFLLCVLFVSYGATYLHVPRSLGIATIIFAVSGLACSLPFFIFRSHIDALVNSFSFPRQDNSSTSLLHQKPPAKSGFYGGLCVVNNTNDICAELDAPTDVSQLEVAISMPASVVTASLAMIVVGMMLQGCAKSPRTSFTVTYIDNNTGKTNSGLYMGIITATGVLGPVLAFIIGGLVSRTFVTLEDIEITTSHPRWIGAWWLGYIICGAIALVVAFPLLLFPRRLPNTKHRRATEVENGTAKGPNSHRPLMPPQNGSLKRKDVQASSTNKEERKGLNYLVHHVRSFFNSGLRLLLNPIYVAVVVGDCVDIFGFAGSSTYLPKYVEQVFDKPAHTANYIMAGRALIGGAMGILLGGYLTKHFKMTPLFALKFATGLTCVYACVESLSLAFTCEQPTVHNWPGERTDCSDGCGCQDNTYFAVCGSDEKTYYSPCSAGCGGIVDGIYRNCTCIPGLGEATIGICPYGCDNVYPFTIVICLKLLMSACCVIPRVIVMIRCVLPKDKGLAVGTSSFMQACIGFLGGPVIFGQVIDTVCTLWDVNPCDGSVGRCMLYDNDKFRVRLLTLAVASSSFCALMEILATIHAKRTGCLDQITAEDKSEGHGHDLDFQFEVSANGDGGEKVNGFKDGKGDSNVATTL